MQYQARIGGIAFDSSFDSSFGSSFFGTSFDSALLREFQIEGFETNESGLTVSNQSESKCSKWNGSWAILSETVSTVLRAKFSLPEIWIFPMFTVFFGSFDNCEASPHHSSSLWFTSTSDYFDYLAISRSIFWCSMKVRIQSRSLWFAASEWVSIGDRFAIDCDDHRFEPKVSTLKCC